MIEDGIGIATDWILEQIMKEVDKPA